MVWTTDFYGADAPDAHTYQKYKVLIDDYRDFINKAEPKHEVWYVGNISIYENPTGRHAAGVTVETGPRRYTDYYLMYDQSDKRTKVIKGGSWTQFHM